MQLKSLKTDELSTFSTEQHVEFYEDVLDYFADLSDDVIAEIKWEARKHDEAVDEVASDYNWHSYQVKHQKARGASEVANRYLFRQEQIWAHQERGELLPPYLLRLHRKLKNA